MLFAARFFLAAALQAAAQTGQPLDPVATVKAFWEAAFAQRWPEAVGLLDLSDIVRHPSLNPYISFNNRYDSGGQAPSPEVIVSANVSVRYRFIPK